MSDFCLQENMSEYSLNKKIDDFKHWKISIREESGAPERPGLGTGGAGVGRWRGQGGGPEGPGGAPEGPGWGTGGAGITPHHGPSGPPIIITTVIAHKLLCRFTWSGGRDGRGVGWLFLMHSKKLSIQASLLQASCPAFFQDSFAVSMHGFCHEEI